MKDFRRIALLILGLVVTFFGFVAQQGEWRNWTMMIIGMAIVALAISPEADEGCKIKLYPDGGYAGPPCRNPSEPDDSRGGYSKRFTELLLDNAKEDARIWHQVCREKDREIDKLNRKLEERVHTVEIAGLEEGTAYIAESKINVPHAMPGKARKTHYIGRDEDRASAFLSTGAQVRMVRVWTLPDGRMAWRDREDSKPTLRIIDQETYA